MARSFVVVAAVAALIVLALVVGAAALILTYNSFNPALIAIRNGLPDRIVATGVHGDRTRSYLVLIGATVFLPREEYDRIDLKDAGCGAIEVVHWLGGGANAWQLVAVGPAGVSVELPVGTPPPLQVAEPTDLCP